MRSATNGSRRILSATVDHLRQEHFTTDEEGQLWIHKPREKTSVMSRVPVLPQATALLEKYRDDDNCRAQGKLQPVPSNTNMTRRYAKISEANISREMRRIGKVLTA